MSDDEKKSAAQPFMSRWSQRKQQSREQTPAVPPAAAADTPAPDLPPVDGLTVDSDFSGFMHPKVDENLRRAALKKLFSDPHFNVMDRLDTYIDDYSQPDPLPAGMLAGLRQAQNILAWAQETKEQTAARYAPPPVDGGEAPSSAQVLPVQESAPLPATVQSPDVAPLAAAAPEEDGEA